MADLEARLVRTIGDPDIRLREDPVRILRAIKFAARCDLSIESETYRRMMEHRQEITKCAQARVSEEFYRLLRSGAAKRSMELLVGTSVKSTEQITKAMKMVAAARMRKSQLAILAARPFASKMERMVRELAAARGARGRARQDDGARSAPFLQARREGPEWPWCSSPATRACAAPSTPT